MNATNPGLQSQLSGIAQQIDARVPPDVRDGFLLKHFWARQSALFQLAEHELSGWMGIVLIVFLVAAGCTFGLAGTTAGIAVSVALLVALLFIRHWAIHRWVANRLRPQISRFLSGTGISWSQLESSLDSAEMRFPRLRRHLGRTAYDQFRQSWNPEEFTMNGNHDVIVPTTDHQAELPAVNAAIPQPAAGDNTAHVANKKWEIVRCLQCGTSVVPKADGRCPSCQAQLSNA